MREIRAKQRYGPGIRGFVAAFLFFLGSTVVPTLHQSFHDAHHDHEGGGLHVHDTGENDDDDDADLPVDGPAVDHHHPHGGDHRHGDGSLFHFGAALGDGGALAQHLAAIDVVSL